MSLTACVFVCGQVFKNKKMAGQMGAKRRTVENLWVYKIEPARNLMWVRGQVRSTVHPHTFLHHTKTLPHLLLFFWYGG